MEEIDIKEMLNYFWQKRLYIICAILFAILVGTIYALYIQVPMYKSYTTMLLTKENEGTAITSSDVTLNQNLIDTYREIVKSTKVVSSVINNLKLDYDVDTLKKNISVESINDTEIIKITVIDKDPVIARNIANETAEVFNNEIVKLYNLQNIGVVDYAVTSDEPYNTSIVKELLISSLIGLVLSLAVIFVVYYFDDTIRKAEEIERKLNVTVIGVIPKEGVK